MGKKRKKPCRRNRKFSLIISSWEEYGNYGANILYSWKTILTTG